ncbi:MAG TPA: hypothetical protein VJ276_14270 [Thermoanaerobaculia bacterium]|nr:hypothetical protein [Thermoanaerobaculia bacterium]
MNDDELRRLLKESAEETRRHVEVTVGSLERRMDARFERVDGRLDGMDARFDAMDARFDGIDARFDGIDGRFEGVDGRFDRTDASIAQRFIELHRHMDVIAEDIVDKLEFGRELLLMVDEKLDRNVAEIKQEMHKGFADANDAIHFSRHQHDQP